MDPSLEPKAGVSDSFRDLKDTVKPYVKTKVNGAWGTVTKFLSPQSQTQVKADNSMGHLTPAESTVKLSDIATKFQKLLSSVLSEIAKRVKGLAQHSLPESQANHVKPASHVDQAVQSDEPEVFHDDSPFKVRYLKTENVEKEYTIANALGGRYEIIRIDLAGTIQVGVGDKFSVAHIAHDSGGYYLQMDRSPTLGNYEIDLNGQKYYSRYDPLDKFERSKVYLPEGENRIAKDGRPILQFNIPQSTPQQS